MIPSLLFNISPATTTTPSTIQQSPANIIVIATVAVDAALHPPVGMDDRPLRHRLRNSVDDASCGGRGDRLSTAAEPTTEAGR